MNRKKDGKLNVNGMKRENAIDTNVNSDTQERSAKTITRTIANWGINVQITTQRRNAHYGPKESVKKEKSAT